MRFSGAERHRRALLTILTGHIMRMTAMGASLVTVPLLINYLGVERYGVWATVRGFNGYLQAMSLGLGYALTFAIAHRVGSGNQGAVRQQVASAFFPMCVIAVLAATLIIFGSNFVSMGRLLGVSTAAQETEGRRLFAVLVVSLASGSILGLLLAVRTGYQEECASSVEAG